MVPIEGMSWSVRRWIMKIQLLEDTLAGSTASNHEFRKHQTSFWKKALEAGRWHDGQGVSHRLRIDLGILLRSTWGSFKQRAPHAPEGACGARGVVGWEGLERFRDRVPRRR